VLECWSNGRDKGQRQITDKKDVGFLVLNYFSKFCLLLSVFLLPVLQYSNTPTLQYSNVLEFLMKTLKALKSDYARRIMEMGRGERDERS